MSPVRLEAPAAAFLLDRLPPHCLVILAFHRVRQELPPWHFGVDPAALERTVTTFAQRLRPVALRDVVEQPIRGRLLAVTFDDGFADNAEVAAPLLSRLGVPASFFVTAGCVEEGRVPWPDEAYARMLSLPPERLRRLALKLAPGRSAGSRLAAAHAAVHGMKGLQPEARERLLRALPVQGGDAGRMMTWDQVRGLLAAGMEVGSHGLTHATLTTVGDERLAWELRESRALLEERLDTTCDLLAYPDNRVDDRVAAAAVDAGYKLAVAGGERANPAEADRMRLLRLRGEDPRLLAVSARAWLGPRKTLAFAAEARRYGDAREQEYSFQTQARLVRRALEDAPPGRVLDAGCGAGALVPSLRAAGAREIVGVDAEAAMVEEARRRWPRDRWLRADLARLPFPDASFDTVVSLGVLEYVDDPVHSLRELSRVLRPGGRLLASVPQRRSPNAVTLRLLELAGRGLREVSHPLTAVELARACSAARLRLLALRATNFFTFPLTTLAPSASRRLAEALDPLGGLPLVRPLGGQLFAVAEKPERSPVFWLPPALPTKTTFLERELDALRELGVDVEPVAPSLGPEAIRAFLRRPVRASALGFQLQSLKARRDKERGRLGYVGLLIRGLALAERLEGRPGRIHATFADGVGTTAYVAAALTGRPYSFTAHSPYSLWQRSRLLARQGAAADLVACETRALMLRLRGIVTVMRAAVVRSPAPLAPPTRRPSSPPHVLLCVGHLIPHKGFDTALRAVALAVAAGADIRVEIIGAGPEEAALRRRAGQLALGDRAAFAGALPNDLVLDRMSSALALLAPCEVQPDGDRDGLPVTIVDSAACGLPAIATPVSGIPEFVEDGVTGLLVPERDPGALAEAIVRLASDPAEAERLGRRARELARERHDARREAARMASLWEWRRVRARPGNAVADEAALDVVQDEVRR